jgi:glycosyltransferase involved in cell wall biosynthesis
VNTDRFVPAPRDTALLESFGIPGNAKVVLSLCRLITFKDVAFLLRAFALREMDPAAYLLVVGDGPRKEELIRMSSELGIAPRVKFAGLQLQPERFFPLGDVYVLPSFLENCPLSLLQALACGLPSIARRHRPPHVISGCGEMIDEGVNGFLIDTEEQLAHSLALLLSDPERRRGMANAARNAATARFSLDRHLRDIEHAAILACEVHAQDRVSSAV